MMRLHNVSARYQLADGFVNAVDNIDFTIPPDVIMGIAGESGCGKSTLLKIMYDLLRFPLEITSGEVTLETGGGGVLRTGTIRENWWKEISYVPQGAMHVMNPVLKVGAQFLDAVRKYRKNIGTRALKTEIVDYLAALELPAAAMDSYPHQLSGGMKQRILIALATFLVPPVVLADEPTTALDVVVQRGILTMLMKVQKANRNSVVIVSHDMGVHYQVTGLLGIMYAGQMIEIGKTADLFQSPAHPYTRMLIGALPTIGDISQKEGIAGTPPSLRKVPGGCRFAARCPMVRDICRAEAPGRSDLGDGHRASCHAVGDAKWRA